MAKVIKKPKAPKISVSKISRKGNKVKKGKSPMVETMQEYMTRMDKTGAL